MKEPNIQLSVRETAVLMGFLNDASGYPYQNYEKEVLENKEEFNRLFDVIYKNNALERADINLAILALKQAYKHQDENTLRALHDDVTKKEIQSLLIKLNNNEMKP
jgi:hypothetical protein